MKTSEDKFRVMVDTVPALLWWDPADGSDEFLNQRWHEYTGVSQEESQGSGWQVAFHPEDLVKVFDKWQAVPTGEPAEIEIEARLRRFDGEYRWFLVRAVPVRDENGKVVSWYGSSTDIEDRKRAEEKLRQDERELRRITDAIPQTIVVQDPDGTPLYANQAVLDYTDLALEDVTASDFRARIFHPEDIERLREERQAALSRGVPFEIEQRALRHDGQYRWFLIRYNPFHDEHGRLVRWYATGTDIEDRKTGRRKDQKRKRRVARRDWPLLDVRGNRWLLCGPTSGAGAGGEGRSD
jgi:formate hydrogenlyase transcriptional activator